MTFVCLTSQSQSTIPKQYKFKRLNEEHNLTNCVVNAIAQDTLGFVWVGTEDGLFRFDGKQFNSYRRQVGTPSIPNNTVNSIFVDASNNVWALTDYGIGIYNYQTDSIISFRPEDLGRVTNEKTFEAAVQDKDGAIYIGTASSGILKHENGVFKAFNIHTNNALEAETLEISDLVISETHLWVGTWRDGVLRVDLQTGNAKHIPLFNATAAPYIFDLTLDATGSLWVATDQGFQVISSDFTAKKPTVNISDEVLSISVTDNSDVWMGTRLNGLYLFKEGNLARAPIHFKPGNIELSVSHRTISSVFQDKAKNLWLGTHNKGINVFNPSGENVAVIKPDQNTDPFTLDISSVWGISGSSEGGIWVGTDGGGLYYFDPTTNSIELTANTKNRIPLTDNAILAVHEISNGSVLIGTYAGGLNILNKKTGNVQVINTTSDLQSDDVRAIYEDISNNVWIGTNRGGLYQYDSKFRRIEFVDGTDFLDIRGILEIPNDEENVWLATYGNGLAKFNKKRKSLEYFNWSSPEEDFTPISLSLAYAANKIWIGSKQSGLISFDPVTKSFEIINESKGLLNNTVRAIVTTAKHVWLSTNMGITAYELSTGNLKNYDAFDGIIPGQFNDGSGFLFQNKYVVFGGIQGMIMFDPEALLLEKPLPEVTFTSLELDNETVRPNATSNHISSSISIAKKVTFGPDEDVFTFHFSVLDYPNPSSWNYEYKLDGFDKIWNTGDNIAEATYRNVPPGNYTFSVRLVDSSSGNQGNPTSLTVSILPPWWKTVYAYMAFALVLFIVLYMLYKYNYDRAEMRQSLLYEQKLRHQEHETMQDKIRFYTNFSHEMRTPITLITGPANDLLRNENISSVNKKSLRLIKRNANTLLKLINRLLEFRKLETENTVLNVGYHDLTILAQEEAESFSYLAKDQDIKFGFYCETDLEAWIDIEKFQIIINNLLSNALKYAEKDTKVTFKVFQQKPNIIIEVQDEGRGIDASELSHIFSPFYQAKNSIGTGGTGIGLALCKSFVELHDGSISVESKLGSGSTFKVTFPEEKVHLEKKDYVRFIDVLKGEIDDQEEDPSESNSELGLEKLDNEKVLLVAEDNVDIRSYVTSLFEAKFRVLEASDGVAALKLAKETIPDIIISDIMMPEMDGLEFCKTIKGNVATSHVPVILLTAKGTAETKVEGYDVGADGYVTKPFDSEVLIARVNNLLQTREHLKELHESGQWMENKDVPSSEIEFVLKVESVVLEMVPKGELNVIQLCRELGFSRTSLYRKIKSLTGQSIKQFIRSIKLKKAAEMLASEDMAVSEVAFSLDFTDLKYFRSCFKKQYGMLPSEYQNENKSVEPVSQEEIKRALNI